MTILRRTPSSCSSCLAMAALATCDLPAPAMPWIEMQSLVSKMRRVASSWYTSTSALSCAETRICRCARWRRARSSRSRRLPLSEIFLALIRLKWASRASLASFFLRSFRARRRLRSMRARISGVILEMAGFGESQRVESVVENSAVESGVGQYHIP